MDILNNLESISEKESAVINGGNFSTLPSITWPIIVPFGDPS